MTKSSANSPRRLLVTGAAGALGRVLRERLAAHLASTWGEGTWTLRWSDRAEMAPLSAPESAAGHELVRCDLADAAVVSDLLAGVHSVIHLGGFSVEGSWDVLASANLLGVIHLYEAARRHGCDRVLFASSNHAIGFYRRGTRIDHRSPPRPDSRYGVTKAFGEDLGWLFAHKHGVRSFNMRIGSCVEAPRNARMLSTWLSYGDFLRLLDVGLRADYRYEIVYGVSANAASWWDNRRAIELGYAPQDDASTWTETLRSRVSDQPVAELFHGGHFAADEFEGRVDELP
jgi:uronate dehydrogenase